MPYRAMALVAASLLFATQSYAGKTINGSKSSSYRQTTQPGGTKADRTINLNSSRSNNYRMGGGGGRAPGK